PRSRTSRTSPLGPRSGTREEAEYQARRSVERPALTLRNTWAVIRIHLLASTIRISSPANFDPDGLNRVEAVLVTVLEWLEWLNVAAVVRSSGSDGSHANP